MITRCESLQLCSIEDISSGVEQAMNGYSRWTLYLRTAGAIDITIEISPIDDASPDYFEIEENPISFTSSGEKIIEFGYDVCMLKLTGSNTSGVTAYIVGVTEN